MNEEAERLAGIEPGDSNPVRLAKTVLALDNAMSMCDADTLLRDGLVYAQEVLNANAD